MSKNVLSALFIEPLQFAYEHSKPMWLLMNGAYTIFPITVMWVVFEIITEGFQWLGNNIIGVLFGLMFALAISSVIVCWILQSIRDNIKKELVRKYTCPICNGYGYILLEGSEKKKVD